MTSPPPNWSRLAPTVTARGKLVASREAAIGTQEANVRGLEADVRRLNELQRFKRIVAPFDGTVTRRYAEVGSLVSTLNPAALFHVQNSSVLRVQIDVPQAFADGARKATAGEVILPESPEKPRTAQLARTANALDPTTRTLRVELELPNEDRAVLAGTYAQVRIATPAAPSILVPTNVLRYSPRGVEVVAVREGTLDVRPVSLGRDHGRTVEVVGGLGGSERLVVNPADDLRPGEPVRMTP